jgi:hypothetical protein
MDREVPEPTEDEQDAEDSDGDVAEALSRARLHRR